MMTGHPEPDPEEVRVTTGAAIQFRLTAATSSHAEVRSAQHTYFPMLKKQPIAGMLRR
jgi:hypothetical protein